MASGIVGNMKRGKRVKCKAINLPINQIDITQNREKKRNYSI
jgi:hypothetical protein